MLAKNDIYNHIGEALADRLPVTGEAEIGMDHNRMFLRMGGQVFAITVEELPRFRSAENPVKAAQGFMVTLPYPFRSEE